MFEHFRGREFSRADVLGRLVGERVQRDPLEKLPPEIAERVDELKDVAIPDTPVILHPYFGFVANPESPGINSYGFFQEEPLVTAAPNEITVAIFGGSLADQVFYLAEDVIVEQLSSSFSGERVRVVSTALGGYKQPQQLNVLSFMLQRGAEYDYVVNIDGFNEIESSVQNFHDGISPFFPHNWRLHARRGLDPQAMMRLGKIEIIRQRRSQLRRTFSSTFLRRMTFVLVLWDMLDTRELEALRDETVALREILSESELPPRVTGPPHDYESEEALYADLAGLWARSSLQMDAICDRYGVSYLHFLQPNQYVPNSKQFAQEEREVAFDETYLGGEVVPLGYPLLSRNGRMLRESGVRFVDLTKIFAAERRAVYSDFLLPRQRAWCPHHR